MDRPRLILESLFHRILPSDHYPRAWTTLGERIIREIQSDPTLSPGLPRLDAEAAAVFGHGFPELHPLQQDELLDRLELDQVRTKWPDAGPAEWLSKIVNLIGCAYQAEKEKLEGEMTNDK